MLGDSKVLRMRSTSKKKNNKIKILLVEDEESLAQMYSTKFTGEGYEVIIAADGYTGLQLAQKKKPNLILLDIILPQMDGFMVLKELKKSAKTKKIPVIMLTNLGQTEDIERGKELGADDYLVKASLTPSELVNKVKKFIKTNK